MRSKFVLPAILALVGALSCSPQSSRSELAAEPTIHPCANDDEVPLTQTVGFTYAEAERRAAVVVEAEVTKERVMLVRDDPDRLAPGSGEEALERELIDGKAEVAKFDLSVTRWLKGDGPPKIFATAGLGGEGIFFSGVDQNLRLVKELAPGGTYWITLSAHPRYPKNHFELGLARPIEECGQS